jgi:hypothetical protein
MNEQQLADELGTLIDNPVDAVSGLLPADDAAFALRLLSLADQTHADATFADALEVRLKAMPRPPFANRPQILNRRIKSRNDARYTQGRLVYAMATVAAALVIVVAAALAVPALQNLSQPVKTAQVSTPTVVAMASTTSGYQIANRSLRGGFHALGNVLHVDDFAVTLIESALTSYVNFISSD